MSAGPFERREGQGRTAPFPAASLTAAPGPAGAGISAVENDRLEIGDLNRRALWWVTIPMAIILMSFPVAIIFSLITGFHEMKVGALSSLDLALDRFGEQYVRDVIASGEENWFRYVYPDRDLSIPDYLRAIWIDRADGWKGFLFSFAFSLLFSALAIFLFCKGVFYQRTVPLIFDRERQAVYTWRRGEAMAAPWERLMVSERPVGVAWLLQDKAGKERALQISLGGSPFSPVQPEARHEHVGRIAAFMQRGASAIDGAPFRHKEPFSLRVEEPPQDFGPIIDQLLSDMRARA